MAITIIQESDMQGKKISELSDRPTDSFALGGDNLSSSELKARHDALALLAIQKLNELINALNGAPGVEGESLAETIKVADEQTLLAFVVATNAALATKYVKPGTGIPAEHLAEAVQTALSKANTALQSHQDLSSYVTLTALTSALNDALSDYALLADVKEAQILSVIDFSAPEAGYIQSSNGNVNTGSSSFSHTRTFNVKKGQKIIVNVQGYDSGMSAIAYHNGTKFVNLVSSIDATVRQYSYVATMDMSVSITYNNTKQHDGIVVTPVMDYTDEAVLPVLSKVDALSSILNYNNKTRYIVADKNSAIIKNGFYVDKSTGTVYNTQYTTGYSLLKEYPVSDGDKFIVNAAHSYCLYDAGKNYIADSGVLFSDVMNEITISGDTAKYISVNFDNSKDFGIVQQFATDFDVINMGDSIFGFNLPPYDVSTYIQLKTGVSVLNAAFGGTHASVHPTSAYDNFSFYKLADAIYEEDFTDQQETGSSVMGNYTWQKYKFNINRLATVDFSKVKLITVAYGTNDWASSDQIDNENDKYDTDTYLGALRYGIEKILSKYPHINIVLVSPIYRADVTGGSDTYTNSNGKTLIDFVDALKSVAEEYHLLFVDNYHNIGLNSLTYGTLLMNDAVHPKAAGVKRIAGVVGSAILNSIDA